MLCNGEAPLPHFSLFFFKHPATSDIYTLSLHDALPIYRARMGKGVHFVEVKTFRMKGHAEHDDQHYVAKADLERWAKQDRKSTRLNSSHPSSSYAVFCLKKKTIKLNPTLSRAQANLSLD